MQRPQASGSAAAGNMAADHAMYLSLRWPMLLGHQQHHVTSSAGLAHPSPLPPRDSASAFSTVPGGVLPPISSLKSSPPSSSSTASLLPRSLGSLHPAPRHPSAAAFPAWLQHPSYLPPPPPSMPPHHHPLQDKASAAALQAMHLLQHDPLAKAALMDLSRMGGSCYPLGKKLFGCPQCRYITDRKNNLKRHVATMHQDCDKMLECCGVMFKNKASLRDHVLIFHSNGYMCRYCGRNFCRKALLKRHLTVHSGQKDFLCEHCDYATSHKSNLERHKRVHERGEDEEDEEDEACRTVTSSSDAATSRHHPSSLAPSSSSAAAAAPPHEAPDADIDLLDGLSDMEDIDVESTAPVASLTDLHHSSSITSLHSPPSQSLPPPPPTPHVAPPTAAMTSHHAPPPSVTSHVAPPPSITSHVAPPPSVTSHVFPAPPPSYELAARQTHIPLT